MNRSAKLVIVLAVIIVIAGLAITRMMGNRGDKLLVKAQVAVATRQYDKAMDLAQRYQQKNPDSVEAAYVIARALELKGDFDGSEEALVKAEKLGLDTDRATLLRGGSLIDRAQRMLISGNQDQLAEAVDYLHKADGMLATLTPEADGLRVEKLNQRVRANGMMAQAWASLADRLAQKAAADQSRRALPDVSQRWETLMSGLPQWRRQGVMDAIEAILNGDRRYRPRLSDLRFLIGICREVPAAADEDAYFVDQVRVVLADSVMRAAFLAAGNDPAAVSQGVCDEVWTLTGRILENDPDNPFGSYSRSLACRARSYHASVNSAELLLDLLKLRPDDAALASQAADFVQRSRDPGYYYRVVDAMGSLEKMPPEAIEKMLEYRVGRVRADFAPGRIQREALADIETDLDKILTDTGPDNALLLTLKAELLCDMQQYDRLAETLAAARNVKGRSKVAGRLDLLNVRMKVAREGLAAAAQEILRLRSNYPGLYGGCRLQVLAAMEAGDSVTQDREFNEMIRMVADPSAVSPVQRITAKCDVAELAVRMNSPATATRMCDEVLAAEPGHARAWLISLMARAYSEQDNPQALLSFAMAANGTDVEVYLPTLLETVIQRSMEALEGYTAAFAALDSSKDTFPRMARNMFNLYMLRLNYARSCCEVLRLQGKADQRGELVTRLATIEVPDALHAMALADSLSMLGDADSAVAILSDPKWSDDPRIKMLLMDVFGRMGRLEDATALLDSAGGRLDPDAMALARAMIYVSSDRRSQAENLLASVDPAALSVAMKGRLAALRINMGDYDGALAVIRTFSSPAMTLPENMSLYIQALSAAGRQDDLKAVTEQLFNGMEPAESLPVACRQLAAMYNSAGRLSEALSLLRRLSEHPDIKGAEGVNWTEARFQIASLLSANGLYDRSAEEGYELITNGIQGNDAGLLVLGRALSALGRKSEAAEALSMIASTSPQYLQAEMLMSDMLESPLKREARLARLTRVMPTDETVLLKRMAILADGDPAAAVRVYRDFADRQGDALAVSPAVTMAAASLLWQLEDYAGAFELMRFAYACSPTAERALDAALLSVKTDPTAGLAIITRQFGPDSRSDRVQPGDALGAAAGAALATLTGNREAAATWAERYESLAAKLAQADGPVAPMSPAFSALVRFVARTADFETAFPADVRITGFGRSAIDDMRSRRDDPASARLLMAALAANSGQGGFAYAMADAILASSPSFQWAAIVAFSHAPDVGAAEAVAQAVDAGDGQTATIIAATAASLRGDDQAAIDAVMPLLESLDDPALVSQAAVWLMNAGERDRAIELSLRAWQSGSLAAAANNAAYLIQSNPEAGSDQLDRARQLAEEAYALIPNDANLLDTLGWIHYRLGDYAKARGFLAKSLQDLPGSPVVQYHMAMADIQLGDKAVAEMRLRAASSRTVSDSSPAEYVSCVALAGQELARLQSQ